jgi:hypothetical protein
MVNIVNTIIIDTTATIATWDSSAISLTVSGTDTII